jgi:hypothetical protein
MSSKITEHMKHLCFPQSTEKKWNADGNYILGVSMPTDVTYLSTSWSSSMEVLSHFTQRGLSIFFPAELTR